MVLACFTATSILCVIILLDPMRKCTASTQFEVGCKWKTDCTMESKFLRSLLSSLPYSSPLLLLLLFLNDCILVTHWLLSCLCHVPYWNLAQPFCNTDITIALRNCSLQVCYVLSNWGDVAHADISWEFGGKKKNLVQSHCIHAHICPTYDEETIDAAADDHVSLKWQVDTDWVFYISSYKWDASETDVQIM